MNYGIILVPEGLVEFIPEMRLLIQEIDALYASTFKDKVLEDEELLK